MTTILPSFVGFPKMGRLSRECIVTEKIDGTNAQILITEDGQFLTGSRTRWITPQDDNFGFSKWAHEHKQELMQLGVGSHFGEWWGSGIQRGYGLPKGERRFSLFNVSRWVSPETLTATVTDLGKILCPSCCHVVPTLYIGAFDTAMIQGAVTLLGASGSKAAPGFMDPEGIVVYHTAAGVGFKKTIKNDEKPKGATPTGSHS